MKPKALRHFLALAGSSLLAVSSADAQTTYTWNNSNVDNTTPKTLDWFTGGSNSQASWSTSPGAQGSSAITNADTVQFFANTTTPFTNTVAVVQNSVVNNGGTAVQLGALTLSGRGSSTANANFTMNLSGDALNFSAATGTVNLDALPAGRTFTYNVANDIQLGTASSGSVLTFTGAGGSTGNSTTSFNFTGNITSLQAGSSSLIKSGSSGLSLSGINTFNSLTLSGGILQAGNNSTSSGNDNFGAAGSTISVTGNSTIQYATGVAHTFAKAIDIASGVTLTFVKSAAGSHTYQGVLSGGNDTTVLVNDAGSIAQRTLDFSNTANTFTGTIDLQNSRATVSFNSLSDGSGAGNIKFGTNAARDSAFQFGSGAVAPLVLTNRRIEIIAGASASGTAAIYNNAAHTLMINSDLLVTGTGGTKTLELRGTNTGNNIFGGLIADGGLTALSLTKNDAGTWMLTNNSNSYTGFTRVSQGTLVINSINNAGLASVIGSGALILGDATNTGTLLYTGAAATSTRTVQVNSTTNNNTGGGAIINNGSGALTFTASTFNVAYTNTATAHTRTLTLGGTNGGTIEGAIVNNSDNSRVGLSKTGTGTWTLQGINTFTGSTSISGGGILVLDYTNNNTSKLSDTASVGTFTLGGATLTLKGGSHTETVLSTSLTANTGSSIKRDGGTSQISLQGTTFNTFATLAIAAPAPGDPALATTTNANATGLTNATSILSQGRVTVGSHFGSNNSGNIVAFSDYATATTAGGGSTSTVNQLTGGGTMLASLSSYALRIANDGGSNVLELGNFNLALFNNSTLLYAGGGANNYTINGTGFITSASTDQPFVINTYAGTTLTVNARIEGRSSTNGTGIVKAGDGTLVVGGANDFIVNGVSYIQQGVLRLANNTGLGATNGGTTVQAGAALELSQTTAETPANIAVGAEALTLNGYGISNGGALRNHSGDNSWAGAITIGIDGSRINSNLDTSLTLTGGIVTAAAQNITFGGAGNTNVSTTAISGTGNLIKDGLGTLTLSATNTYTGATTVTAGTLLVNNTTGSGTGSGTVSVGTLGTLGGSGTIAGATTVNGNLNPGNSPGVLSFNTSLALAATTTTTMEIDGTIRGTGYDGVNIGTTLALDGNLVLDIGMVFTSSTTFNLFNVTGSTTGDFDNVSLQGAMGTGSFTFAASDVWSRSDGNNTWTFTESTGVLSLAVIPEPSVALLSALGVLLLFRRRR